ncbi:hypothetical protein Q8A67_019138 [Cirrhinus molitorella]|uniref:Uncharacterized protein n=1 Tax=Cirrhinus molitorella TaxID=172907 RepID=A0AA88PEY2_9TELE|nr:hypothetical protein Q8A67_019138 [Cirrhinus molitorella]
MLQLATGEMPNSFAASRWPEPSPDRIFSVFSLFPPFLSASPSCRWLGLYRGVGVWEGRYGWAPLQC